MKNIIAELVSGLLGQYVPLTFYQAGWKTYLSIAKLPTADELPNFLHSYGEESIEDAIGVWFEEKIWSEVAPNWESDHKSPIIRVAKQYHHYLRDSKHIENPAFSLNVGGYHDFILKALQSYLRSYDCQWPDGVIDSSYCAVPYPMDGYDAQRHLISTNIKPVIPYFGQLLTQILSGEYNYLVQSCHNEFENGPLVQLSLKRNRHADRLLSCVAYNIKRWRMGMMAADSPLNLTSNNKDFLAQPFSQRVMLWREALRPIAAVGLFSLFRQRLPVYSGHAEQQIEGIPEETRLTVVKQLNEYFNGLLGYEAVVKPHLASVNTLKARNYTTGNLLRKVGPYVYPEEPDRSREAFDWTEKARSTHIFELYERVKKATQDNGNAPGMDILKTLITS